jgi:hypothetical protein
VNMVVCGNYNGILLIVIVFIHNAQRILIQ